MKDIIINRLTDSELDAVAELEALCFPEPWSANALQLLTSPDAVGFVCMEGGRAVSYGGMLYTPFEGQITNIAVAPDKRRCGYGRAIVDALIRDAEARNLEQIALEVRASNEAAIALYKSLGFFEAGRRKHFYKNPAEDALVMLKPLKED
jgi:ribosomal-protein-alanine N-acetyltransferase